MQGKNKAKRSTQALNEAVRSIQGRGFHHHFSQAI